MTAATAPPVKMAGRERAGALHSLAAPCLGARARRFVSDAGEVDWLGLELAAGHWSYNDWLLVRAAHDLDDGTATAGLRPLCTTLAPHALRRVLEAIAILRPDTTAKAWPR
jgi:hypothetical protein